MLLHKLLFTALVVSQLAFGQALFRAQNRASSSSAVPIQQVGATVCIPAGGTTGSVNTTGATLLVMSVSDISGSAPAGADSKSNTWSLFQGATGGGAFPVKVYDVITPTVGTGHTFTGPGGLADMCVSAWKFTAASPRDVSDKVDDCMGGSTCNKSITTTQNNDLVIAVMQQLSNATCGTINSSFSSPPDCDVYVGGTSTSNTDSHKQVPTAGAVSPTFTVGTSGAAEAMVVVSYKAANP